MKFNLPALALSAAIMAGLGALVLQQFPLPSLFGAATGPEGEAGLRQKPEAFTCRSNARTGDGGYLFEPPCGGQAPAPDGRILVVRNAGRQAGVGIVRADGTSLAELGVLDDGMEFAIHWSRTPGWFFANHALDRDRAHLRLFHYADGAVAEHPGVAIEARRILIGRYCEGADATVEVKAVSWIGDGTRLTLTAIGRSDCSGKLIMEADAESGRIAPGSIREMAPAPYTTE